MIHLDTSFLVVALVRGSRQDCTLREWLRTGEPLVVPFGLMRTEIDNRAVEDIFDIRSRGLRELIHQARAVSSRLSK